ILYAYLFLIALCTLTFKILGMGWFDAFNHAIPAVATGGFSTHDASFGHFDSVALEIAASIFMLTGALPFILYVYAVDGRWKNIWADEQLWSLLGMLTLIITVMSVWLWLNSDYDIYQSVRYVSFNVISVVTTTGFVSTDYNVWGPFASMGFLFITYLGACAGSTSGGIKVMRLIITGRMLKKHIKNLVYPNGVFIANYQGRAVSDEEGLNIMGFLGLYVASNVVITVLLCMTGLDFDTAISGAAQAIANVGPGLGPIIGPAGNFSTLHDEALWLLSLGMLLGRLEILTIAVIFSMRFWKG
ncbi:MAG TPA: potassium transporter TrkG, partial [Alphaproteobacteria bacterium]|nr:potassium transporter TrkG [Alphaproteobacteria bacterium]